MKEFQKDEYCHKKHAKVPSKSDSSTSNALMEDFTPGWNSAIAIIEQGVVNWKIWQSIVILTAE